MDGTQDHQRRLVAARTKAPHENGHVLIIGDSVNPPGQRQFASQTPGAVTVESVDLRDLVGFAKAFDLKGGDALKQLVLFAQEVMTNVGAADLLKRVDILKRGTSRKAPTDVERAAMKFLDSPTYSNAIDVMVEIGKEGGVRTHRPGVLHAFIKTLRQCSGQNAPALYEAAVAVREQNRLVGRPLPRRAVGSTLLLKGLEADVAVILDTTRMDAKNLYVAMTRVSKMLVICSPHPVLTP